MVDGSVRMNITVPAALKKRMDNVRERVNWSAVAGRAFESEVDRIQEQRKDEDMSEIVKRLRETKRAEEAKKDEMYADGFEAGKEFAASRAKAAELENLYENYQSLRGDFTKAETFSGTPWDAEEQNYPWLIHDLMGGSEVSDSTDFDGRLEIHGKLGMEIHTFKEDVRFCVGFLDGAVAVWEEVKDQI